MTDPLLPPRKPGCTCGHGSACALHHGRCKVCDRPTHRDTEGRERHNAGGSFTDQCPQRSSA